MALSPASMASPRVWVFWLSESTMERCCCMLTECLWFCRAFRSASGCSACLWKQCLLLLSVTVCELPPRHCASVTTYTVSAWCTCDVFLWADYVSTSFCKRTSPCLRAQTVSTVAEGCSISKLVSRSQIFFLLCCFTNSSSWVCSFLTALFVNLF